MFAGISYFIFVGKLTVNYFTRMHCLTQNSFGRKSPKNNIYENRSLYAKNN